MAATTIHRLERSRWSIQIQLCSSSEVISQIFATQSAIGNKDRSFSPFQVIHFCFGNDKPLKYCLSQFLLTQLNLILESCFRFSLTFTSSLSFNCETCALTPILRDAVRFAASNGAHPGDGPAAATQGSRCFGGCHLLLSLLKSIFQPIL